MTSSTGLTLILECPDWGSWLADKMPMTNSLFLGIRHPTFPYNIFSIIKQVLHQQQPYMDVQGVYSFPPPAVWVAGMPDRPASGQAGTGMNKMPMPDPVRFRNTGPESGTSECSGTGLRLRNTDAGGISFKADAQLWVYYKLTVFYL